MVNTNTAVAADRWRLAPGLAVIQRDDRTVQIGTDPARRVLIQDAPTGTAELLNQLSGSSTVSDIAARVAQRHKVDVGSWAEVIRQLSDDGYLTRVHDDDPVPPAVPLQCQPDRIALHAMGSARGAELALRRRHDAVITILGSGRVAASVATVLAGSGVRHLHLQPTRPIRAIDITAAGIRADELPTPVIDRLPPPRSGRGRSTPDRRIGPARAVDRQAMAALVRGVRPDAQVLGGTSRPADVVVLAPDGWPDPAQSRPLMHTATPHLAVRSGPVRGTVGPFVIPGRSSCLNCHDLVRTAHDRSWPTVQLAMMAEPTVPPAVLATSLAAVAAGEVLRFIDGEVPESLDGTLELTVWDWLVQRRSWPAHRGCYCRQLGPTGD